MNNSSSKLTLGLIAIVAWLAIIVQFVLMIEARVSPILETSIRFFSFFTILTNLLVALYSTVLTIQPSSSWGRFFSRLSVGTATTVYIVVVGLIYNTILRFQWQPQGMQRVVDELLHAIVPTLFLIYWFAFLSKKPLPWNSFFPWLIYPFFYCLYILIRGSFSGFYPYPFMDVSKLGYQQVVINSLGVTTVFLGFSLLFIFIGKIRKQ
ncbi:MAG: hypothetical protein K0R51_310 [Cytophagaceae bacterium]|jgi:hypothetical protein|nr:hypothetical protein [Cytophagaceae bacterium]